jgi:hypothetical protein
MVISFLLFGGQPSTHRCYPVRSQTVSHCGLRMDLILGHCDGWSIEFHIGLRHADLTSHSLHSGHTVPQPDAPETPPEAHVRFQQAGGIRHSPVQAQAILHGLPEFLLEVLRVSFLDMASVTSTELRLQDKLQFLAGHLGVTDPRMGVESIGASPIRV